MIWILLFICIYGTIFCIEKLFNMIGTHIGCVVINQTIMFLENQEQLDNNKIVEFVDSRNELVEIRTKQMISFTTVSIILPILWTLFFYLWN